MIHHHHLCLLSGEAKAWRILRLVKDHKDALKEDIAQNGKADAGVALNATEALRAGVIDWRIVDVRLDCGVRCRHCNSWTVHLHQGR
jgi:hypothetical protein